MNESCLTKHWLCPKLCLRISNMLYKSPSDYREVQVVKCILFSKPSTYIILFVVFICVQNTGTILDSSLDKLVIIHQAELSTVLSTRVKVHT